MANVFDQFDSDQPAASPLDQQVSTAQPKANVPQAQSNNVFDQFDSQPVEVAPQKQSSPQGQEVPKQGTLMDMVDIFNAEVNKFATGQLNLLSPILPESINKNVQSSYSALQQAGKEADIKHPYLGVIPKVAGGITNVTYAAPQLGTAGVGALYKTVGTAGSQLGRMAAAGGLTAAEQVMEPGTIGERTGRGLGGFLSGAIGQKVGESIGSGVGALFSRPTAEAAEQMAQGAKMTLGQATQNPKIQAAETFLSGIPIVGSKGNIQKAAQSIENKAENVLLDDLALGKMDTSDLAKKAASGVIEARDKGKLLTNAAYSKALKTAEEEGIDINLANTQQVAQTALDESGKLANWGMSLKGTKIGDTLEKIANNDHIAGTEFDALRKRIGNKAAALAKGNDEEGVGHYLTEIKKAMDMDLENQGMFTGGKFGQELTTARDTWSQFVKPFKENPTLKKGTKDYVDPDELLTSAVSGTHPTRTKEVMSLLSPETQEDFSKAAIQKAVDNAVDRQSGDVDFINLSKSLHKMRDVIPKMPKDISTAVDGLRKLLAQNEYILQAAKPNKGLTSQGHAALYTGLGTATGAGYAGGIASGVLAALGVGGGIKLVSSMLTNPTVVRQLTRIGGGKISKPAMEGTVKHLWQNEILPILKGAAIPGISTQVNEE